MEDLGRQFYRIWDATYCRPIKMESTTINGDKI